MTDNPPAPPPLEPGDPGVLYARFVGTLLDFVVRVSRDSGAPGDIASEAVVIAAFESLLDRDSKTPAAPPDPRISLLALAYRACVDGSAPRRAPERAVRRWDPIGAPAGSAAAVAWEAASGLPARQYAALDLSTRRQLRSAEIAAIFEGTEPEARSAARSATEAFRGRVRLLLFRRQRKVCSRIAALVPPGARRLSSEQSTAVGRHLSRCARCGPAVLSLADPVAALQALPPVSVPDSMLWWPPQYEVADVAGGLITAETPRTKRRKLRWAIAVITVVALLGGGGAVVVWRLQPSGDARSDAPLAPGAQLTEAFQPAAGVQRWAVPCGVTSVRVVAAGGSGGVASTGGVPGLGSLVGADLPVSPGQQLLIVVGSSGAGASVGGGGTGIASTSVDGRPGGNLLAAGAGGGGGGDARGATGSGGAGGDADAPGGRGSGPWAGAGGAAATLTVGSAGGAGGIGPVGTGHVGGPGSRDGGLGGGPNGAGGGSGYFSGGGGGGGGSSADAVGAGGGGGGGSSFVAPDARNVTRVLDIFRTPRLTITHGRPTC